MTRRRAITAIAGVALAAAVALVLRPEVLPVEVQRVSRGPLEETVDEEGETRVRARFVVAAPVAGRLLRIALEEGDAVRAGDRVARIVPLPLDARDRAAAEARLAAAESNQRAAAAQVELARAALEQARRDADRADRLRDAGTLSKEAHEQALLERTRRSRQLEAARFAADAANHDVEAARAVLIAAGERSEPQSDPAGGCGSGPCLELFAPVAGRVLRVLEESERNVPSGTPLLELGDPADLEIVVDVLSADAVRVRPGARMWIEDWGGEGVLEATVRRVEPSGFTKVSALGVEEQRVNVIADLASPAEGLGDGFRVEARIVTWAAESVLRVSGSGLFRRGAQWYVFTVDDRVARARPVEVGHRGRDGVELRSGLEEGAPVILHPSDRIGDGVRVRPLE